MYLVVIEDIEDGMWFDEPAGFDSEPEAQEWATKQAVPKGHRVAMYRCYEVALKPDTKGEKP